MMKRRFLFVAIGITVSILTIPIHYQTSGASNQTIAAGRNTEIKFSSKKKVSFTNDILPLFTKARKKGKTESFPCIKCHFSSLTIESSGVPENAMTEFNMGSYKDIIAGADAGTEPIIDTDDPDKSLLLQRLK
ncbi:MAG TPA: hypothetical protein VI489_02290, partial [Candidatus Brocadiaceae bacterium]